MKLRSITLSLRSRTGIILDPALLLDHRRLPHVSDRSKAIANAHQLEDSKYQVAARGIAK